MNVLFESINSFKESSEIVFFKFTIFSLFFLEVYPHLEVI